MLTKKTLKQSGFSLIELAVGMIVFGLFFSILSYLLFGMNTVLHGKKGGRASDKSLITTGYGDGSQATIKKSLLFFVKRNYRLPCPDINKDGLEDCGSSNHVGSIPYLDLGYDQPVVDSRNNDVRYGVYRNGAKDADLTVNKNRFAPYLPSDPPGGAETVKTTANTADFCKALENSWKTGTVNSTYVHTSDGTQIRNAAYILSTGGQRDADNNNSFFDGRNGSGVDFELSTRVEKGNYDDLVSTESFLDLYQLLNCSIRVAEINGAALDAQVAEVAAIAVATAIENGEGEVEGAERGVNEAKYDLALGGLAGFNAAFSIAAAATGISAKSIPDIANLVIAIAAGVKAAADIFILEARLSRAKEAQKVSEDRLANYKSLLVAANAYAKKRFDFAIRVEANGGLK